MNWETNFVETYQLDSSSPFCKSFGEKVAKMMVDGVDRAGQGSGGNGRGDQDPSAPIHFAFISDSFSLTLIIKTQIKMDPRMMMQMQQMQNSGATQQQIQELEIINNNLRNEVENLEQKVKELDDIIEKPSAEAPVISVSDISQEIISSSLSSPSNNKVSNNEIVPDMDTYLTTTMDTDISLSPAPLLKDNSSEAVSTPTLNDATWRSAAGTPSSPSHLQKNENINNNTAPRSQGKSMLYQRAEQELHNQINSLRDENINIVLNYIIQKKNYH